MTPLESLLAGIEARAAHLVKDPRSRWYLPRKGLTFATTVDDVEITELATLVGRTDVPRLVAALRRAVELLHDNDSGYATGPCDDEIASLLRGEGGR